MANEFKQCPNGHYYQGVSCPYCKGGNSAGNNTSLKTEVFVSGGNASSQIPTEVQGSGGTQTTVIDGQQTIADNAGGGGARNITPPTNRTVFGDEDETEILVTPTGQQIEKKAYRSTRKLVGWLVTYSFDAMGVDYKIYEGRNIIGRDMDCNITVNDKMMSGKHAVLLFRADKYSLTDSQSSHGTFVNDEDIDLEPRYLKDGDVVRMGETTFKFRTSL
ncbi:MAG: FHA domain-containing protein [Prevotellaceae bacterium]|jgi:hypothetical protein|nr:FHA domain-containing protein [Prevotellaceae bacterium]